MLGSSSRPGSSWLAARFLVQPNRPGCRQSRDVAFLRMPYRTAGWEKEGEKEREEKRRSGCQSLGRIVWEIVKGEALSRKGAHRYRARARSVTSELRLVSTPRRRYVIIARGSFCARRLDDTPLSQSCLAFRSRGKRTASDVRLDKVTAGSL